MQPEQQPERPKSFDITPPQPVQPLTSSTLSTQQTHPTPTPVSSLPSQSEAAPQQEQHHTDSRPKKHKKEEIKNTIFTIALFILAPLFAVLMIVFVFQSYVVDGSSMEPTLQNGNRVFILKLPKTVASIQDKKYIPARNEVIVFKKQNDMSTQLIKRVIGLPGDRVVLKDGTVTVYNVDNPNGFNPDAGTDHESTLEPIDTNGKTIVTSVGNNELFVLGDNRGPGGSLDSHSGLGLVPVDNIVGRLWIRYYPFSEFQIFATMSATFSESYRTLLQLNSLK